jgi:phosphate transport system protein
MPREAFQNDLNELQTDVTELGELVADRLRTAIDAFDRNEPELARTVIEGDDEVNERYLELEQDCVSLLALQQPVASDLRLITASFKVLTDVERVGDLATNIAQYAVDAEREVVQEVDVRTIGETALDLFTDAIDAYVAQDPDACRAVAERDDHLDAMIGTAGDAVVRDIVTTEAVASDEGVERVMADIRRLFLALRDLERVGDHAVNVAARTLYAVENDDALIE